MPSMPSLAWWCERRVVFRVRAPQAVVGLGVLLILAGCDLSSATSPTAGPEHHLVVPSSLNGVPGNDPSKLAALSGLKASLAAIPGLTTVATAAYVAGPSVTWFAGVQGATVSVLSATGVSSQLLSPVVQVAFGSGTLDSSKEQTATVGGTTYTCDPVTGASSGTLCSWSDGDILGMVAGSGTLDAMLHLTELARQAAEQ